MKRCPYNRDIIKGKEKKKKKRKVAVGPLSVDPFKKCFSRPFPRQSEAGAWHSSRY